MFWLGSALAAPITWRFTGTVTEVDVSEFPDVRAGDPVEGQVTFDPDRPITGSVSITFEELMEAGLNTNDRFRGTAQIIESLVIGDTHLEFDVVAKTPSGEVSIAPAFDPSNVEVEILRTTFNAWEPFPNDLPPGAYSGST